MFGEMKKILDVNVFDGMIKINRALHEQMRSFGKDIYKKFLNSITK